MLQHPKSQVVHSPPPSSSEVPSNSLQPSPPPILSVNHVVRLPVSFLSLLPHVQPSNFIVVLPPSLLPNPCPLSHGGRTLANNRIATLYLTHCLTPAPDIPPVALVSPNLHATLSQNSPLTLHHIPTSIPHIVSVTLSPLLPPRLSPTLAPRIANLAKNVLQGRDARPGDIIPLSAAITVAVHTTTPSLTLTTPAMISPQTELKLRLHPTSTVPTIPQTIRPWIRLHFNPLPFHLPASLLPSLIAALNTHPALLLLTGTPRDTCQLLTHALVTHVTLPIPNSTPRTLTTALARAELSPTPVYLTLTTPPESLIPTLATAVSRRHHPRAHLFPAHSDTNTVTIILILERREDVSPKLARLIDVVVSIPPADDKERSALFRSQCSDTISQPHLSTLTALTAGFARRDVTQIASLYEKQGLSACKTAARRFAPTNSPSVAVGDTTWHDVGGLDIAKKQIKQLLRRKTQTNSPSTAKSRNRRVGVLLYGPPGTGKTLLARAVAGESSCAFLSVKGPELLDMYVGESERQVRAVFQRAILSAPTVIFFDEIDALAPRRGHSSDSGRVADRVVSQLLSELDEIANRDDVFVIAATNRPDLVDGALLRPGRLDKLIFVAMPASRAEQVTILKAQTRKFVLRDDVRFEDVLECAPLPPRLSGADLYALAAGAWMRAAKREIERNNTMDDDRNGEKRTIATDSAQNLLRYVDGINSLELKYRAWFARKENGSFGSSDGGGNGTGRDPTGDSSVVKVSQEDFEEAAKELKPSLTVAQLEEYEQLRLRLENNG